MDSIKDGKDLYNRVKPALKCKKEELIRNGYKTMSESDIWNTLLQQKWIKDRKIALCDIVDDILNTNNEELFNYYIDEKRYDDMIELPKLKNE